MKKDSNQQVLPSKGLKIKLSALKGLSRPAAELHTASGAQSSSVDTGSHVLKRKRAAVDSESSNNSDSESKDPPKTEKAPKKQSHHSMPSTNLPKKQGQPPKSARTKAKASASKPQSSISATVFVSIAQLPELVHGKTAKKDKLIPQKPHVEGPFTLTKYTTWKQFVDEVAESVGVEKENLHISSLTCGFQKQKDILPLTNEKGFWAMREQIWGKNGSGTIVFVYHPIISQKPKSQGTLTQAYQVKDDEEKGDVSSETRWGKKVSMEKDHQVYIATHVTA